MHDLVQRPSEIAVVGWSCRLPGAASIDELWSLLANGRCSVSRIPPDRWPQRDFWHPRPGEPGKSYTFAAGVLDDIWGFDPAVFGISPREAEQMDPQQRLLLELVWEALEDAGLPPSSLAGKEVGVFAGASSLDFAQSRFFDIAGGDAYTMTGNSLSLIANRISYIFDFRGPSLAVDTACSSSLVALEQAVSSLASGRIEVAIVGGVNVLASPFAFIGFSQASMLSRTGLCRAFDAAGDGYVRAEGGVVLVLRNMSGINSENDMIHGAIVGAGVSSDGRTAGISLPSLSAQKDLLERVYRTIGVDPNRLAFLEAHGTGTPAGDPIEATSVGEVLGRRRVHSLPIGSIKTNVGHLEPASGLAGVMKAMLALKHDLLPASLHFSEPNPRIPFERLNLSVCSSPQALSRAGARRYAGINSFGFGGTNAHVVIADPVQAPARVRKPLQSPELLVISAQNPSGLRAAAGRYAHALAETSSEGAANIAAGAAHRRQLMPCRLAVEMPSPGQAAEALRQFASQGAKPAGLVEGVAIEREAACAFVYSGNGSQWAGMGREAYQASPAFRQRVDEIDGLFADLAGWSLRQSLFSPELDDQLALTHVAQPLTFAIQAGTTHALKKMGLRPAVVLGHSVGEIAAAEAAGILNLREAVRVIHSRSLHQELARGAGRMAVAFASQAAVEALVAEVGNLEIGAFNSAHAFTVSGTAEAIDALALAASKAGIKLHRLDLDYPFHSRHMKPVQQPLLTDLDGLVLSSGECHFVSTVTGDILSGEELDARYWWRNVREPVQFSAGVQRAAAMGARIFVEVGPRMTLASHIADNLRDASAPFSLVNVLDREQAAGDAFRRAVAHAFVAGAEVDLDTIAGSDPGAHVSLPSYPWQRSAYRPAETVEALRVITPHAEHPLLGSRVSEDATVWHSVIDLTLRPELKDHRINGQVRFPGSAFVEIAMAAARQWSRSAEIWLTDFDLIQWMSLHDDKAREVMTRISPATDIVEIFSRPRLSATAWQLHARAKIVRHSHPPAPVAAKARRRGESVTADVLYARAAEAGLNFGPAFRQAETVTWLGRSIIETKLTPRAAAGDYGLDPARFDSCFHGLILLLPVQEGMRAQQFVPVRFGDVRLYKPGVAPARSRIEISRLSPAGVLAHIQLLDDEDGLICLLRDARFQAVRARSAVEGAACTFVQRTIAAPETLDRSAEQHFSVVDILDRVDSAQLARPKEVAPGKDYLLLEGWATAAALDLVSAIAQQDESIDVGALVTAGRLPSQARSWLLSLLHALVASGLAQSQDGRWTLCPDPSLPDCSAILRTLAAEHPERSAELLAAASLAKLVAALKAGATAWTDPIVAPWIGDALDLGGIFARKAGELLIQLVSGIGSPPRLLNILQIGYGPLSHLLVPVVRRLGAHLTILERDHRRCERAALAFAVDRRIDAVDGIDEVRDRRFDMVVSACGIHRWISGNEDLADLARVVRPGALLVAVEPSPSLFRDLVYGLDPAWFAGSAVDVPTGPLRPANAWSEILSEAGFMEPVAQSILIHGEDSTLLLATAAANAAVAAKRDLSVCIVHAPADVKSAEIARLLGAQLSAEGQQVSIKVENELAGGRPAPDVGHVVQLLGEPRESAADALREQCLRIKAVAQWLERTRATFWIVAAGRCADETMLGPIESGTWAFARTLANEAASIDVRRILLASMAAAPAAQRLKSLLVSGTCETELLLGEGGSDVVRVDQFDDGNDGAMPPAAAARLQRSAASGLEGLSWNDIERVAPGEHEIEIAVQATGLNFRDVMSALSLLPEDLLEDGFAGATLGLECAGPVVRTGAAVAEIKPGDRVVAFAPAAFSSHVTVPAQVACVIPDHIGFEAAATIPVAFSTAYYSLHTLAKLRRGEWVLIHGGAGGVGLAALQIARAREARVIVTAGSEEKRALLRAMGADHVLDSRSLAFVDDVRRITGKGVHVVLNSLSGESMELSLKALRPFGRFIELGKRDYVANTQVGLRPLRKNIAYFAVDLDQVLARKARSGAKAFRDIIRLFDRQILHPLPYRCFSAQETVEAFRVMQQSGHIGKLVVQPPAHGDIARRAGRKFAFDVSRTHLITGAFGGFGAQAARFLVRKGVKHLVLVGRSGASAPSAKSLIHELERSGANVMAEACDVADAAALAGLFRRMDDRMPPLAGIMHAAMVLDDAIIANLSEEQLDRVLRPKVIGAENLHRLTKTRDLDYFVLFSSATTFLGNPGQASYVAANGYLEGLARRRRAEDLPAVAIAWGAIGDVGVLTGRPKLAEALRQRLGVAAMNSRDALDLMLEVLGTIDGKRLDHAAVAVAAVDWSAARQLLPALGSPTYSAMARHSRSSDGGPAAAVDLAALWVKEGVEGVRTHVTRTVVDEVSRVLRMPKDDLRVHRPLVEAGLDSLMAVELAITLQDKLGLEGQTLGSVTGLTIAEIVEEIVAAVRPDSVPPAAPVIVRRHTTAAIDPDSMASLAERVESKARDLKGLLQ